MVGSVFAISALVKNFRLNFQIFSKLLLFIKKQKLMKKFSFLILI